MMLNISQIFLYGGRKRLDYSKKIKYKEEDGIDFRIYASEIILTEGIVDVVTLGFGYITTCIDIVFVK